MGSLTPQLINHSPILNPDHDGYYVHTPEVQPVGGDHGVQELYRASWAQHDVQSVYIESHGLSMQSCWDDTAPVNSSDDRYQLTMPELWTQSLHPTINQVTSTLSHIGSSLIWLST